MGATINVNTSRPFTLKDTQLVVNVTATHDASVIDGDDVTPEIGGLFSTVLADGKVGLLANVSYSERHFGEVSTHTDGWLRDSTASKWCENAAAECAGAPHIYRPVTNISELQNNERVRTNAQLVGQLAPNDDVEITLDYVYSKFENTQERFQTGLFGDVSGNTVTGLQLSDTYSVLHAVRSGAAADALVYNNELLLENNSIGLNLKWQVSDSLQLMFDGHSSSAESQPDGQLNDALYMAQGPLGHTIDLTYSSNGLDAIIDDSGSFRGNQQFGGGSPLPGVDGFQDPTGFAPLGTVLRNIAINNEIDEFKFQAYWDLDTTKIVAGISRTDYSVETKAIASGFVFQGLNPCVDCDSYISEPKIIGAPSGFNVYNAINSLPGFVETNFPTSNASILAANPPTFFGAREESTAIYFNLNNEFTLAGLAAGINAGLRYEDTDVEGSAFQTFPVSLSITSNTEGSVNFDTDAEPQFYTVASDYSVFLPSLDFHIEPAEDQVVRLSYGESIARPDLNGLRPTVTVSDYRPGVTTAATGNPDLKPYAAENIDLSYEWYYDEGSYVSAALFYKKINDYISTSQENDSIPDTNGNPLLDPQGRFVPVDPGSPATAVTSEAGDPVAIFEVTRLLNTEQREVNGLEVAVQHLFGNSGFGMQANYTTVSSDAEFNSSSFTVQSPLIGLSDSANLVGFYEANAWSIRLAMNWREKFLYSVNQLRATNEPVFFAEYTQFDLSSSYNINDNLTLSFEVLNITGEDQLQTGRYAEQFLFANDQEPRYALGLRGKF